MYIFTFFLKHFETYFTVANDDLEGTTTHFTDTISGPKIPKPPVVEDREFKFAYVCSLFNNSQFIRETFLVNSFMRLS